jgi:putative ABC transport system substrate-binding protein
MPRVRALAVVVTSVGLLACGAAWAQSAKTYRLGLLMPFPLPAERLFGLREGLRALGYDEVRNLTIVSRSADGDVERLPALARELASANVDVIVAVNTPGVKAAMEATRTIPIVMVAVGDPVASGFVQSLARPGGNVTGLTNLARELSAKRLALLREALPSAGRVAMLGIPDDPIVVPQVRDAEAAARSLGIEITFLPFQGVADVERVVGAAVSWRAHTILMLAGGGQNPTLRRRLVELFAKHRMPAMVVLRQDVEAGALMSYWVDDTEHFRRAAGYVDRILKGAKPGELPVEQPTKFDFVINLKTARSLGLTIPQSVRLRADHLIK